MNNYYVIVINVVFFTNLAHWLVGLHNFKYMVTYPILREIKNTVNS